MLQKCTVSRTGFEPVTKSLKGSCSTAELPALKINDINFQGEPVNGTELNGSFPTILPKLIRKIDTLWATISRYYTHLIKRYLQPKICDRI